MSWKHQNFHSCYALMKILMFSTHLIKYIWYSPKKKEISSISRNFYLWLLTLHNWQSYSYFTILYGKIHQKTKVWFFACWEIFHALLPSTDFKNVNFLITIIQEYHQRTKNFGLRLGLTCLGPDLGPECLQGKNWPFDTYYNQPSLKGHCLSPNNLTLYWISVVVNSYSS